MKTVRNARITSFDDAASRVPGVTGHLNPPRIRKPWTIAHENGQECSRSRVLMMSLESCTGGHGASKSSRNPKTVDNSPRKRPKMPEIMSFDDAARVVYRGSRGIEILPGPQNCGAHENCQKCLKSRVLAIPRVVYRGSRGIEIRPGPQNRGL